MCNNNRSTFWKLRMTEEDETCMLVQKKRKKSSPRHIFFQLVVKGDGK